MKTDGKSIARKIGALLIAIAAYYIVHEGAHLIYALAIDKFLRVVVIFPGVQVVADTEGMTAAEVGLFCVLGAAATLTAAYALCLSAKRLCKIKSVFVRAVLYYVTLALLLADPIYLSVLCGFFGGGDMNGIALFVNETAARAVMGVIAAANAVIFFLHVLPAYRTAFAAGLRSPTDA